MQALTPLLFSMLFPRFAGKNAPDTLADADQDDTLQSVHHPRAFHDGYVAHDSLDQHQRIATNARRHRSTDSLRSTAATTATADPISTGVSRNSTFPSTRRAANRPKHLSLDHAAFIATYPMLDGLGDTDRSSNEGYYSPLMPRKSTASRTVRKRQSQDVASSRSSTSSISSMVSDASSSSSTLSSPSSMREPLTPTQSVNYRSILKMESSSSAKSGKKSNGTAVAKDLINLGSFGEVEGEICLSPQSNNFVDEQDHAVLASTTAFEGAAVSRGERQLIAH